MKAFWMLVAAAILLVGSTFAKAEKPRQAPPAMTEQEIKDYIDAQVEASVQKAVTRTAPPVLRSRAGYNDSPEYPNGNPNGWRVIYAPTRTTTSGASCPAGCVSNGDGTCSCPEGTACGSCASCGMSQSGDDGGGGGGGGSCANGSCGKSGSGRHLLGRIFHRRRNK